MATRFSQIALLAAFVFSQKSIGQNVIGTVADGKNQPLEAVTVALLRASDSAFVKAELSDAEGRFEFFDVPLGGHRVAATMLGFEKFYSEKFDIAAGGAAVDLPKIELRESAASLAEATVAAQKPFVERRLDRLVVNVENSIASAGATALEVLERAPSVFVNQENGIVMKGKSGVLVYFDGKPTPLTGADLIGFIYL